MTESDDSWPIREQVHDAFTDLDTIDGVLMGMTGAVLAELLGLPMVLFPLYGYVFLVGGRLAILGLFHAAMLALMAYSS